MEDDADRISQLPEHIMEKILFLLPSMDVIRMSFLSKTWLNIWNSMPVSDFDFLADPAFRRYRYSSIAPLRPRINEKKKKLEATIDESLKVLEEDEKHHQKRIIDSFTFRGSLFCNGVEDLHPWIRLVTNHHIKVLELHWKDLTRYGVYRRCFPYSLGVDATSLVVLRLSYFTMEPYPDYIESSIIPPKEKRFPFLREISLVSVRFTDSVVDHLLSRCPSLQILNLDRCLNLKSFRICGAMFPKLNNLSLVFAETLDYKIELPDLQTLRMEGVSPIYDGEVSCGNVKKLIVRAPLNKVIGTNQLEKLMSKFPLLEDLTLSASFDSAETKISGQQLKKLTILATASLADRYGYVRELNLNLNLDTPNLHRFLYNNLGARIAHSNISLNSTKLEVVDLELQIIPHGHLGTPWFLRLQKFLKSFTPEDSLNVTIFKPLNNVAFSVEELSEENILPLPKVKHLCLKDISTITSASARLVDYTSLINGLLWCFHPVTLSVQVVRLTNNNLIEFIYEKLICREENPLCCKGNRVKCWRHYLKSVEIQSFSTKEGQHSYGRELSRLPENMEEVEKVTFDLQWFSSN